jgi:hypothetical protein
VYAVIANKNVVIETIAPRATVNGYAVSMPSLPVQRKWCGGNGERDSNPLDGKAGPYL